ncbi:major facilitator superfamily MFS-1 [Stipitochalara longipes BDJ]|nr:major facilitator superfamily MFS-1 [Stipitochalara longipes BDJ]
MLAIGMAVFLAALDITIITTALETIASDLHSSAGLTWIGSSYLLATTASTPIWGKISDIFGRKPILLVANFVFFTGSLVAGLSVNIGMLTTARAIQGIGAGGLLVLTNICIADLFSPRRRGAYYSILGAVWALANSLGPILGGVFTTKATWRWCFYINLPLDGIAFFIILFFLDLKTPRTPLLEGLAAIDWLGAFFILAGTLIFLFGLELGGTNFPWNSGTVICLLIFGVVAVALFVPVEIYIAQYPIIPMKVFTQRSSLASLGVCFFHAFTFIAGNYYLPLYFQAVLGLSPLQSGVHTLALSISTSITSVATGLFIRKTGTYISPILLGFFFMTLAIGLFINLSLHSSISKIIIYQILAGIGIGPNFTAPLIALQSSIPPRDIGAATSTFFFTRMFACAISVVAGGVIIQNVLASCGIKGTGNDGAFAIVGSIRSDEIRTQYAISLQRMWILYVCTAALGLITALFIKKVRLSKEHKETETGLKEEIPVEEK